MPKREKGLDYSVVVPVYNEAGNISQMDKEIKEVMNKLGKYETIYVNDGSRDKTLSELKKLKNVRIINLNRNYGQSIAFDAGFKASKGNIVISMDGDLQNDSRDIPRLLRRLQETKVDVVAGWRINRKDKGGIKLLSKTGRFLRHFLLKDNVHDSGCALRVYREEAVKSLDLHGEMHRYILALLRWKGFRITELPVNHRARMSGKTHYSYNKAIRGFIDLIYIWFIQKYSQRPLHMFGYLSLFSLLLGLASGVTSIVQKVTSGLGFNRNGLFFLAIFFILASIMFFSFGIILDLLITVRLNNFHNERRYYIRESVDK